MKRRFVKLLGLALAGMLACPALGVAQMIRGAVTGTVRDATGAVVPGVAVTATNEATNIRRSTVSDTQGFYRIAALDPGTYIVRAELSGFQTVEYKQIRVVTAQETTLNVELKVAGVGEAVTVIGKAEALELNKVNATVGLTSTSRQVVELPLGANRDVNTLIGLTPNTGVVGTFGQGTYTANGQRSRNNNYMIDGSDNNDISVTIPTSQIVPEAVAEYQVLTNAYSVEFGRNSGAMVNVITKSGSNQFHGEAWDYYRDAKFYSLTNLQKASGLTSSPGFRRHQAGASIGGPIIKDRTFFFLIYQYDGQRPETQPSATTVRIPTQAGFAALAGVPLGAGQTAQSRSDVLSRLGFLQDIYGQNPNFRNTTNVLVNGVPIETAQTNVNINQPSTYHTLMGRIDHRIGDSDNLTARYHYNKRKDIDQVSNCALGTIFCGSQDLKDTNLAISETHLFSSTLLNEARFSLVKRDLLFPENDPTSPTATISGLFTIGGLANFPQSRVTDAYQLSNTLTWTKGKHTLKVGADLRYNKADNLAAFDSKGTFTFNNLQDYMNNLAATFQQALQTASWNAKQWQTFFYAQDDFRPTPDLTLNLGLRYELSGVPLGFFGATDPQSLAALVPAPVQRDTNNWAPRVGFSWSPRSSSSLLGDGKTVVRGGFGMGYDVLFYNLLTVNASNYPRVVVPQLQNVQNQYPNLAPVSGSAVFNSLATFVNSAADTENPEAKFWSLSVGRELGDFVVEVGYAGSKGYKGINQIEENPPVLTADQAALVASGGGPIPSVQARRIFPQFGSRITIPAYVGPGGNDVEARSSYNAVYVSLNKRLAHGVQFGANYTYSKWMSNNDASLGETGTDASSQRPQDMFDYAAEWSRSQFDRPHRLAVNYLWEVPGPKEGVLSYIIGGWQFSGVTTFQSGRPFTVLTGVDSNGDGSAGSDRPNIGAGTLTWDPYGRSFTNDGYFVAPLGNNNLPLQNALGDGNSPRNGLRAAGYWNWDMSLMKRFHIGQQQLVIRADGYNIFNQDNFDVPVLNMSSPDFGKNIRNWGQRTFTFSAKFIW